MSIGSVKRSAQAMLIAALLCPVAGQAEGSFSHELQRELLLMQQSDQAVRAQKPPDWSVINEVDTRHTARLKEIVATHGWPSIPLVGPDGAEAAWLIAQHASKDPAFQLQVLALIRPLSERGEVDMVQYAYLYDRLHRPQRYGTQGRCTPEGKFEPREIEDAELVDERRAQAGISPQKLADYVTLASQNCQPQAASHVKR